MKGALIVLFKGAIIEPFEGALIELFKGALIEPFKGALIEPFQGALIVPFQGALIVPFKGALIEPFKGALIEPFKGALIEPFKGALIEPFKGALIEPCKQRKEVVQHEEKCRGDTSLASTYRVYITHAITMAEVSEVVSLAHPKLYPKPSPLKLSNPPSPGALPETHPPTDWNTSGLGFRGKWALRAKPLQIQGNQARCPPKSPQTH